MRYLERWPSSSFPSLLWVMVLLIYFTGCSSQPSDHHIESTADIRFDFPDGWSRLSRSEGKKQGVKKGTMMVGNDNRWALAFLTLVEMDLSKLKSVSVESLASKGVIPSELVEGISRRDREQLSRVASVYTEINVTLSSRYQELDRIREGIIEWNGEPVGEMVFTGKEPGEEKRWRRLLILVHPDHSDRVMFFGYGAPFELEGDYLSDFQQLDDGWQFGPSW